MNTRSSLEGKLTIVANRRGVGSSFAGQRPPTRGLRLTLRPQRATRNVPSIRAIFLFLLCISGTLATIVGCGAQRGTIGAQLGQRDDGRLFIRDTPRGLAAQRAGLHPGDEITLINGQDVRSFDEKGLHRILEGEVGDPVKLTVLRGEQVLHVTLQRTPAPRPHKSGNKPE